MAKVISCNCPSGRNEPATIEVDTTGIVDDSPLTAEVHNGKNESFEVEVREGDNGKYTIVFAPPHSDVYTLNIKLGDNHVEHSPLQLNLNRANKKAVVISEPPSGNLKPGQKISIGFDASSAGRGELTSICLGEEAGDIPVEVIRTGFTSHYVVMFTPPLEDIYTLHVYWSGKNVKGSPFKLDMIPVLPSKVVASNLRAKPGALEMDICTKGAGKAHLNARCTGLSTGNIPVKLSRKGEEVPGMEQFSRHDYLLTATTGSMPDTYSIDVSYGGCEIPDSPFTIEITSDMQYASTAIQDLEKLQEEYLRRLDGLIQKKKKTTDLKYLKTYFIGTSGLGKTATRKRLTGAILNLSKLKPEQRKRCSTYLAECTQVLAIVDDSDSKLVLKASDNLDEEAQLLFNYLYHSSTENEDDTAETATATSEASHKTADQQPTQHATKDEQAVPQGKLTLSTGKSEQVKQKHITVDVEKVITRLKEIVGSGEYTEQLLGKILLNLVDVGGQPGFLEMLPFLSKGPGMFLAFFPLDKDLDELIEVSYEREGDKITPYNATYTNRETVSRILSSISHHVSFDSTLNKEHAAKLGGLSDAKPVATLVGTFKDKLETQVKVDLLYKKLSSEFPKATKGDIEDAVGLTIGDGEVPSQQSKDTAGLQSAVEHYLSSEQIKQEVKDRLEQVLQQKNEALRSVASNFQGLLSFPTDDRCFIALDNYTGTDSDIDPLRNHLQKVFSSHFKDAKIPIQPSQLLLGIVLRKEYDIVSMEDCIEIGLALNMNEDDVKFTVWFLDFLVGALIHHPEIDDDWFRENIICSPQVVFDSISALITESLLELHSPSSISKFTQEERKNWTERGQFSFNVVKCCLSEKNEEKVRERKLIPVDKLILLLEHSNLLAQITLKEKVGGKETKKAVCFIPAILECATHEQLTKSLPPDDDTPSSVKITFDPRYVPIGVFCAMISRLVSKGKDGILGMKWELPSDSCVKRNLVTFHVEKHIVTLVTHIDCIEIRIIRQKRGITLNDLCSYVLSAVIYIMKEINRLVCPIIAFDCPCGKHQAKNAGKLCLLMSGTTPSFECEVGKQEVSLTPQQQCWFAKEVEPNSGASMKALQYAKRNDLRGLEFDWSIDGPETNEFKLNEVTDEDCEGYYTCEIYKRGESEPFFNVYRCFQIKGECEIQSAESKLLDDVWGVRSDWYSVAVELGISHGTRKAIKRDYQSQGVEWCFKAMIKCLLEKIPPHEARTALVRALKSPAIDCNDIVMEKFEDVAGVEYDVPTYEGSLSDPLHVDKHLKMVRAVTWEARAKWNGIAIQLDILPGDRKEIENDYRNQSGPCFTALLEHWLTRSSPPPTWDALIEAMHSEPVGHADIAIEIKGQLTKNI